VQDEVTRCLEETRRAVWDLRDRGVGGGDLGPALARSVRRLCQAASVPAQVHTVGKARHLPHAVEDDLFRIGREAVTNALKHARPTRLEVRLAYEAERVTLTVTDDGAGFAPEAVPAEHFGLLGMRERAARIGATLEVRSAPGEGTTVQVVLPHA
jgi:signal transduction histidine kinase